MEANKLLALLQYESDEIITRFNKASIQGQGTPQEVADFREGVLNEYLRRYFPFPHRLAKGIITDSYGTKSASVDSIIINPIHPYTIDVKEKFSIILADGVDVAIEVKPDISTKTELLTALKQSWSVKKLLRVNGPLLLKSTFLQEEIDHSLHIPSFIFSIKAKADISDSINEMLQYYIDNKVPKIEQIDFLVILGRGIVINHKIKEKSVLLNPKTQEKHTGFTYHECVKDTFAAFILYLNSVHHASATFHGNILPLYLQALTFTNVLIYPD